MSSLFSIAVVMIGFLMSLIMGLGISHKLLPATYQRYTPLVAPITGFTVFSLLTIVLSGSLAVPVNFSSFVSAVILTSYSALITVANLKKISSYLNEWVILLGITIFMLLVTFWPVFDQGIDLYLGTSNPDFYQSLSFLDALQRYNLPFFIDSASVPLIGDEPFPAAFPDALQARFGGVAFALLIDQIAGIGSRPALMTAIVVCLLFLPSVMYFFASSMLKMDHRTSLLSALLVAISAPISMSFLHVFVGQNTSLAILPFTLTLVYLALKEQSMKLTIFAALVTNSLVFIYVMMLPYILAPLGLYAVFKACTNRNCAKWLLKAIAVLLLSVVIVHIGMIEQSIQFIKDLSSLLGGMAQSHYYIDFLTEYVLIYATGVSSYPWSHNNFLQFNNGLVASILLGLAFSIAVFYAYLVTLWMKQTNRDAFLAIALTLTIYMLVWFYYTFVSLYGYASFKMSAWLSFIIVPYMAFGMTTVINRIDKKINLLSIKKNTCILSVLLIVYIFGNLFSSIDYQLKSYGTDRQRGSIINAYGLGGNSDMEEISHAVESNTHENSTISIAFPDLIANGWAAYYLYKAGRSTSVSSHWLMPDDEAFLPDVHTGMVQDVAGKYYLDYRPFFKNGRADYYLVPSKSNLNIEIVQSETEPKAVWENESVRLIKAENAKDLLLTGRGFYRTEYFIPNKLSWWFPDRIRWSSEGGEILHFNPSKPGQAYRLSFVAIVGYGISQDTRVIEIFHNGKKIDEQIIYGNARVVSKPYYPELGVNKLVIRIKEKVQRLKRNNGLWHKDIPLDWRQLNVAFSQVSLVKKDAVVENGNYQVDSKQLLEQSLSFNGFNIDGWLRDRGEFTIKRPSKSTSVQVKFHIPGITEYTFPYAITFIVDGKTYVREFEMAGENSSEFKFEAQSLDAEMSMKIIPHQHKTVKANGMGRDLTQSIHINGISFYID